MHACMYVGQCMHALTDDQCETQSECSESDLVSRRDRCHCPPTVDGADICFWLPFDKQAFLAASLKTKPELHAMFRERLVWDDAAKVNELMSLGLLQRIDKPSVRPSAQFEIQIYR